MTMMVVVGNGLLIDFCQTLMPGDRCPDPKAPLAWPAGVPALADRPVLDILRELAVAIRFARQRDPAAGDFAVIDRLSRISAETPEWAALLETVRASDGPWARRLPPNPDGPGLDQLGTVLRHLLRMQLNAAYLEFNRLTRPVDLTDWAWTRWFAAHRAEIGAMVSLNYDLLLERCFSRATGRALIYTLFEQDYSEGVPLHKPHGSVNFRNRDRVVSLRGSVYDNGLVPDWAGQPLTVTRDPDDPALTPAIVLPGEYESEPHRRGMAHGARIMAEMAFETDHCVVAGLSYWEPDRPELNALFNEMRRSTRITLVNPQRNERLETALGRRFSAVRWVAGPAEVDQPALS